MKWFDKNMLHTVAKLRSAYKELLKIYHLDNGSQESDMQEISRARVELELEKAEKKMIEDAIPVGHITCHTLRHAFATRAIESGMKPQVLKTILRHSNISMTMDLYSHVLERV